MRLREKLTSKCKEKKSNKHTADARQQVVAIDSSVVLRRQRGQWLGGWRGWWPWVNSLWGGDYGLLLLSETEREEREAKKEKHFLGMRCKQNDRVTEAKKQTVKPRKTINFF